jgi:large subunit ribosomal protein L18
MNSRRQEALKRRHQRIRQKVKGTAARPRLAFHKSARHLYAQLVDDVAGQTLAYVTTSVKANGSTGKNFSNIGSAKKLGADLGSKAKSKGVESVVFDRGGFPYHGVVQAFADAAREAGLKF